MGQKGYNFRNLTTSQRMRNRKLGSSPLFPWLSRPLISAYQTPRPYIFGGVFCYRFLRQPNLFCCEQTMEIWQPARTLHTCNCAEDLQRTKIYSDTNTQWMFRLHSILCIYMGHGGFCLGLDIYIKGGWDWCILSLHIRRSHRGERNARWVRVTRPLWVYRCQEANNNSYLSVLYEWL